MRVVSVVGARPQFVKLAAVARAMESRQIEHVIVHTGQHYDPNMSDVFFDELRIPAVDHHLGIGSGSHGAQTGAMLAALDPIFLTSAPDWVLVYGDTNSTLAAALSAVKLHVPVAHLEAGLRSFNRRMPEEHNRVLTDHAADLCLAPTEVAMGHLADEGLSRRSVHTGDVMTDICFAVRDKVLASPVPLDADVDGGGFVLATVHRPDNTDDPETLSHLVDQLAGLSRPVVLAVHPRLRERARDFGITLDRGAIRPVDPLSYPALVSAVLQSDGVITDSGGLQKEAFLLGRLCTTIRTETEWTETLVGGWNVLDPRGDHLSTLTARRPSEQERGRPYGDGDAADRVVRFLDQRTVNPS
jgi:UDP-N-acetylglucosamine 2-epimerase (non-hydrolysing)